MRARRRRSRTILIFELVFACQRINTRRRAELKGFKCRCASRHARACPWIICGLVDFKFFGGIYRHARSNKPIFTSLI